MSDALAIAATTVALRNLLMNQVPALLEGAFSFDVTTSAPDVAAKDLATLRLNLFLYRVEPNAGWRNMDMPRQLRPGESGTPPLPLNLNYLLTVYNATGIDADATSLRVLGAAMSVLHDHPLLGAQELRDTLLDDDLQPISDVADQIERLRITQLPLTIDDVSKLWSAFQTSYRMSVAYEVSVVLIDSRRPARAPLPVLRRGSEDSGALVGARAAAVLTGVTAPLSQPAARQGEQLVFSGTNLVPGALLRMTSLASDPPPPRELAALAGEGGTSLSVTLPVVPAQWAPGFYRAAVVERPADAPAIVSNEVVFALAPGVSLSATSAAAGDTLTLSCSPRVRPGQRVLVLFGDRQLPASNIANPLPDTLPSAISFVVPDAGAGAHVVRLRVDGVDSIPVILAGTPPLAQFDPAQQVTL